MKTKFFIAALASLLAIGTVFASMTNSNAQASGCAWSDCTSSCCGSSCGSCESNCSNN